VWCLYQRDQSEPTQREKDVRLDQPRI
jgi:hypothetical protein